MCLFLRLQSSRGCDNWMLKTLKNITHEWWLIYLSVHGEDVRAGLLSPPATSAPLANQQIPLIPDFGLEHFHNIHPFNLSYPHRLKDVLMVMHPLSLSVSLSNLNPMSSFEINNEEDTERDRQHTKWNSLGGKKTGKRIEHSKGDILTLCEIKKCLAVLWERQKRVFTCSQWSCQNWTRTMF